MSAPHPVAAAAAHGKINLFLGVGPVREDGYHDLATVFQAISARDEVRLVAEDDETAGDQSPVAGLLVRQTVPGEVPADATNLAWRAVENIVRAYRARHGEILLPRVTIEVDKGIPVAGGMAGGSADAAAALVAADHWLSQAYAVPALGPHGLHPLAAALGADVPFVLQGNTAYGTGRGDELVTMLSRGTYHWAVVTSKEGLSTPAVFRRLDEMRERGQNLAGDHGTHRVAEALASGDVDKLAGALHNELQPAALSLRPDLRKVLQVGQAEGALAGIVSGSGPTCVFLCPDAGTAAQVAQAVAADTPGTAGTQVTGPAGGAGLITG